MSADTHSFNVQLATIVGLTESILLQHFFWWYLHARNLPDMHREGRVWFYRSVSEIREQFPYLSDGNIRTAIQHLIDRGLVVKGDYSSASMYKATWYSLDDSAIRLFDSSNPQSPFVESQNGFRESDKSKCNSKKDNSKDNRKENNNIGRFDFRSALLGLGVSVETADTWLEVRRRAKAVNSELAFKELCSEIAKSGQPAEECIRIAAASSWRGFKADYLRPRNMVGSSPQAPLRQQRQPESIWEHNARIVENIRRSYENAQPYDEQ